jgi:hypothetical protein
MPEEKEPILADRSAVQRYAVCPYQASIDIDVPNKLKDVGNEIHGLVEEALKSGIENQMEPHEIAEEIVDLLPTVRPDIQPQVIRAARYVADEIAKTSVHRIIGVEYQIDFLTDMYSRDGRPFKLTSCLDLLMGGNNSLIVTDWKSGFKKRSNQETFDDFQAQFAAFILWQMWPEIHTIHWFFKETFWGSTSYACFERNHEYPSMPHLTQEIQFKGRIFEALKLWQDESTEAWPEEKKCTWCDVVTRCPHAVEQAKDINKDPKGFIDQMVVKKVEYDNMLTTAKDYLKAHGESGCIKGTESVFEWRKPNQKFTPKMYKQESVSPKNHPAPTQSVPEDKLANTE